MATITLGTSGNDFLYGDVDSADLDDYIQGLDGDDVIFGFSGNNILDGGDGNDFMSVLLGVNTVIGGAGLDGMEVDYTGATAGIQMTLAANGVDGQITAGSNRVTFTGIEQFFIAGTDFDDVLLGGQSNDVLFAGNSGNDQLRGGAGDDVLYAYWSSGASTLNGGLGDDSLTAYGSSGSNTLLGAEGNDYLTAEVSSGNNTLRGGAGDDVLSVNLSTGNNYLEGGAGNDVLQAEFGEGSNTLLGGDGDDVIDAHGSGPLSRNILNGGAGNDLIIVGLGQTNAEGEDDSVTGGTGFDHLQVLFFGGAEGNTATDGIIMTLAGNDKDGVIQAGNDAVVFKSIEQFTLYGTAFNDVLLGGKGNDILDGYGLGGSDFFSGGAGNDTITTVSFGDNGGSSTLLGGAGDDQLVAGGSNSGSNFLDGGNGNDTLFIGSSTGNDTLLGGNGDDVLTGISAGGSNTLNGGNNNDVLYSGSSQSLMIGGTGDDVLSLGADDGLADTVQYKAGDGLDRLYDFVRGLGGDSLVFSQIADIDVVSTATNTTFHLGDGIDGNAGFGSGQVLAVVENVTDFSVGDVGVNLFGSDFFFA